MKLLRLAIETRKWELAAHVLILGALRQACPGSTELAPRTRSEESPPVARSGGEPRSERSRRAQGERGKAIKARQSKHDQAVGKNRKKHPREQGEKV